MAACPSSWKTLKEVAIRFFTLDNGKVGVGEVGVGEVEVEEVGVGKVGVGEVGEAGMGEVEVGEVGVGEGGEVGMGEGGSGGSGRGGGWGGEGGESEGSGRGGGLGWGWGICLLNLKTQKEVTRKVRIGPNLPAIPPSPSSHRPLHPYSLLPHELVKHLIHLSLH